MQRMNGKPLLNYKYCVTPIWSGEFFRSYSTSFNNCSKVCPVIWLVTTTCIIHHNQLLLTKFGTHFVMLNQWLQKRSPLQIINVKMTSKVQPAPDYCTIVLLTEKIWVRGCVIFGEQKNKELVFSFKSVKIF